MITFASLWLEFEACFVWWIVKRSLIIKITAVWLIKTLILSNKEFNNNRENAHVSQTLSMKVVLRPNRQRNQNLLSVDETLYLSLKDSDSRTKFTSCTDLLLF